MDYRAALIEFYQKHNPERLKEVDALLAKYRGREEELLHALKVKYQVKSEPPPAQPTPPTASAPTPPPPPRPEVPKAEPTQDPPKQEAPKEAPRPQAAPPPSRASTPPPPPPSSMQQDLRGKTAAERAEYWRKELERREMEKSGKTLSSQSGAKDQKASVTKEKAEAQSAVAKKEKAIPPPPGQKVKSGSGKKAIIAIILLLIIGAGVFAFLNDNIRHRITSALGIGGSTQVVDEAKEKKGGIDPNIVNENQLEEEETMPEDDFALDDEEEPVEDRAPTVDEADDTEAPADDAPERVTTPPAEKTVSSGSGTVTRGQWYISYISVNTPARAEKDAADLEASGFSNVAYYYIPDYDPNGAKMYKVVLGPYTSAEAAQADLEKVQQKGTGAYPYILK